MNNLYKILNVTPDASPQQIKDRFRLLAKRYHPDGNSSESSAKIFQMINEAYRILSDDNSRNQYDRYFSKKKTEPFVKPKSTVTVKQQETSKLELIRSELNNLLWDMDDLLRENNLEMMDRAGELFVWQIWYRLISFIEHWLLGTRDYKQKILERRLEKYSGIRNYFYDVRKNVDKLLSSINEKELYKKIGNSDLNMLDLFFEILNHTVYYLNFLTDSESKYEKEYTCINKSFVLHK